MTRGPADYPTISVVTPTWQRHDHLILRCIPSVADQLYPRVEHIVVSDGKDNALYNRLKMDAPPGVRYAELDSHDPTARWGHWARLAGIEMATGDLIAYLDDDNSYRPQHLWLLASALGEDPDAGFAYPRTLMHVYGNEYEIGTDPPQYGHVDTSGIVHRRGILEVETWKPSLPTIDWDLVNRWMIAGIKWVHVPEVTCDYFK